MPEKIHVSTLFILLLHCFSADTVCKIPKIQRGNKIGKINNQVRVCALQRHLFHTEIRWLSKERILLRFNELEPTIVDFFK